MQSLFTKVVADNFLKFFFFFKADDSHDMSSLIYARKKQHFSMLPANVIDILVIWTKCQNPFYGENKKKITKCLQLIFTYWDM